MDPSGRGPEHCHHHPLALIAQPKHQRIDLLQPLAGFDLHQVVQLLGAMASQQGCFHTKPLCMQRVCEQAQFSGATL